MLRLRLTFAFGEAQSSLSMTRTRNPAYSHGVLDLNQHITVFNLQRIHDNLHVGILLGGAGLRVPRPAVPRAHHLAAFNHSLPQRPSAVQAYVVHGAENAINVGNADGFRATGEFFSFVDGRELGFGGDSC